MPIAAHRPRVHRLDEPADPRPQLVHRVVLVTEHEHVLEVAEHHRCDLIDGGGLGHLARRLQRPGIAEDPGPRERAPPDHHARAARLIQHHQRIGGAVDVAVADDRDRAVRMRENRVDHAFDPLASALTLEAHLGRPPMDRDRRAPDIDQSARQRRGTVRIHRVLVPAQTHLRCERDLRWQGLADRLCDMHGVADVAHEF